MKRFVLFSAVVLLLAGLVTWLARGAHTGWTQTSVPVKTLDEVTGIESIDYEKQFVPGVDFLGAVLLGAGALATISIFIKTKN